MTREERRRIMRKYKKEVDRIRARLDGIVDEINDIGSKAERVRLERIIKELEVWQNIYEDEE